MSFIKSITPLNFLKWYFTGLVITLIITESGKITVGRLRPHFLDVCKPDFTTINCTDVHGIFVHVDNFECHANSPKMVADARYYTYV